MSELPSHLFASSDGALYDTRTPNWSAAPPVRFNYRTARHESPFGLQAIKAALRNGASTDLGCYPLFFVTHDGEALSFASARECWRQIVREYLDDSRTGWRIEGVEINYEDGDLYCAHSGERIPSAYAEPDDDA